MKTKQAAPDLMVNVSAKVPKGVRERLEDLAAREKRKLGQYLRIVLEDHATRKGKAA